MDQPNQKVISEAAKGEKQGEESDSEEEVFMDVDRVQEEEKRQKTQIKKEINQKFDKVRQDPKSIYDPLKREPKFSNATNSPLWELAVLANHSHPTIQMWAEILASGKSIDYSGDPILDFGTQNFLDRISYKDPKVGEKAVKFRKRMAQYEAPVTSLDFAVEQKRGDKGGQSVRAEEQYMYKYH